MHFGCVSLRRDYRTGTFGIGFQTLTINVFATIYLTLQVLLEPASSNLAAVLPDPIDLKLLPISTFISFVIPTLGLALPFLNILDKESNYTAIALWQPFPLYQSVVHPILRAIYGGGGRAKASAGFDTAQQKRALARAYRFVIGLTMGVHLLVAGVIVTSFALDTVPTTAPGGILAVTSLSRPPTLALLQSPVSALASGTIVSSFLRWDVYCTCASLAVWAGYQWNSVQKTTRLTAMVCKIVFWGVLGGPLAPAAMLLWERDEVALSRLVSSKKPRKTE